MRILYIAQLSPNESAEYRRWTLVRQGHEMKSINTFEYGAKHALLRKIEFRACVGPEVDRINRDILAAARSFRPDVVWCDKVLWMRPATLERLQAEGIFCFSYMIDNFFGPRRDPGWRLYAKTIPIYDLHCTQRDSNVRDYRKAGARDVIKVQTAFEPTIHFPPEPPYTDAQRTRGVSFIGSSYDDRATTLTKLSQNGVAVDVSGNPRHWTRDLQPDVFKAIVKGGELYGRDYRETIWRSRINLSFLTHSNQDEFVHKSFEIAACGGFLLAERSSGHMERFVEDQEAVFFTGYDELLAKIRRYLPDEEARNRIALAGQHRAWSSGYDNDTQVRRIVEHIQASMQRQTGRAA